jgi:hypothetical protein
MDETWAGEIRRTWFVHEFHEPIRDNVPFNHFDYSPFTSISRRLAQSFFCQKLCGLSMFSKPITAEFEYAKLSAARLSVQSEPQAREGLRQAAIGV